MYMQADTGAYKLKKHLAPFDIPCNVGVQVICPKCNDHVVKSLTTVWSRALPWFPYVPPVPSGRHPILLLAPCLCVVIGCAYSDILDKKKDNVWGFSVGTSVSALATACSGCRLCSGYGIVLYMILVCNFLMVDKVEYIFMIFWTLDILFEGKVQFACF